MSGGALTSCSAESNPCRRAYIDYCGHGVNRPSWDPLTLIAAVRGAEGVRSVFLSKYFYENLIEIFSVIVTFYLVVLRPARTG